MVEFLNSQEISFDLHDDEAIYKLPPLKKKVIKKLKHPIFLMLMFQ